MVSGGRARRRALKVVKAARWQRYQLIASLYRSELLGRVPECDELVKNPLLEGEIGVEGAEDISQQLGEICREYPELRERITGLLRTGYTWESNFPLVRAVLVVGCYLLKRLDAPIVIDELVEYTKTYVPGNFYKFVNGILDSYYKTYIGRETMEGLGGGRDA